MMILLAKAILLLFLLIISIAILLTNTFINEVIYLSVFSLIMALLYLVMLAPDVAITESAVGVCITTLLLLWTSASIGTENNNQNNNNKNNDQNNDQNNNHQKKILAFITVFFTGLLLFYALPDLPEFGSKIAPAHNDVYRYYLENTEEKFGFPNTVTAILAGFRGYDTLGETVVIFTAAISILFLLKEIKKPEEKLKNVILKNVIKKVITKMMLPIIMIFGIYVQVHGELTPGGGFQSGVILASGIILYSLVFGSSNFLRIININHLRILSAVGALIYLITGLLSIFKGGNFLDYSVIFPNSYIFSQKFGIFVVEIGVGVTVFSVMLVLYFSFYERLEK